MEHRSTKSEHLSSESFESRFTATPLLENLEETNLPLQQQFCMTYRTSGFYAGQATSYPISISKQDISFNLLMQQQNIYIYARQFLPLLMRVGFLVEI
ncbi:MAG: hypothetical protein QXY21_00955 [Candidatus Micrarchaeaceae archaeon]